MEEVANIIIATAIAVIGWFIQRLVSSIDKNLRTTRDKVWKLQEKTSEQLAVINNKLSTAIEEVRCVGISTQNIRIDVEKIRPYLDEVDELSLSIKKIEDRLNTHGKFISQLRSYLPTDGKN